MTDGSGNESDVAALREAWLSFHNVMDQIRQDTEKTERFEQYPEERAKAYHLLFEIQAMAYNFAIAPRSRDPRVQCMTGWQSDWYTLGTNSPDFLYGVAVLDASRTYKMNVRRGDRVMVLFQVHDGLIGVPGARQIGNYDIEKFAAGHGSECEIILSPGRHEGNWIELDPQLSRYNFILIRSVLLASRGDRGSDIIEYVEQPDDQLIHDEEFSPSTMVSRIGFATHWAKYLAYHFNFGLYDMYLKEAGDETNKFVPMGQVTTSEIGSPHSEYAMAVFSIAEDEALVIDIEKVPDGPYWSFQVGDVWSRSLHFLTRQTTLNNRQIVVRGDGSCTAILSHKDVGHPNWLDTLNHKQGVVCLRNYGASAACMPSATKVKLDELPLRLAEELKTVNELERGEALRERRARYRWMLGE